MTRSSTRRKLLIGLPLLAGMGMAPVLYAAEPALSDIERRNGGRLGLFAIDTGSGRTLAHRADERFLMCSTFKGILAAQVLARVDKGTERLDRLVRYTEKDLIFTSPVTKAHVTRGAMSIDALCRAVLVESDNTAAILLMRSAGGPAGLTQFVRRLGGRAPLLVAVYYDAPGISMAAREAVLREAGAAFVQWATSGA